MSEVIYANMAWKLILDTGLDLTSIATVKMRQFDPAGASTEISASKEAFVALPFVSSRV